MEKKNNFKRIIDLLLNEDDFLITSHVSPDGDNLGSVIAMKLLLEQLGKETVMIIDDELPPSFSFLADSDQILIYNDGLDIDFKVAIILDCGSFERVGRVERLISDQSVINIDHHADNSYYGTFNLVKNVAATGELVYQLINRLNQVELTEDIATALAVALMTDTGSFQYSNTTSDTHQIMAKLVECGASSAQISQNVFNKNSYQNLALRGRALQDIKVDKSGQIAWIKVSKDMLKEIGATDKDTEGLVNYPRSLIGVKVALLLKETDDKVKISLRSNDEVAVNLIAHQLGGGGHPNAAGCVIDDTLDIAERIVIDLVKEELSVK